MRTVVLALGVAWLLACGGSGGFDEDTPSALCGGKAVVDATLPKALQGDRYLAREVGTYRAPEGLFVSGGTLCVEPGVRVEVGKGGALTIGGDSEAALVAVGVDEAGAVQPIVFTSASEIPHIGDWDKIHFTPKNRGDVSRLEHVTVEFAGAYQTHGPASVTLEATRAAFVDVTVRKGQGMGIYFEEATAAPSALEDLRFEALGLAAISIDARHLGLVAGPLTFAEQGHRIEVRGGSLYGSATLADWGAPWDVVDEGITVQNGGVLTLGPGVRLRLDDGVRVVVGGQTKGGIELLGTAEAPVWIGPLNPPPGLAIGVWDKLILTPNTTRAVLRHAVLEGGGALSILGGKTALLIGGAVDEITDLRVVTSGGSGVLLQEGAPVPEAAQGSVVVDRPEGPHVELGPGQLAFLDVIAPEGEPLRVGLRGGEVATDTTLDAGPDGLITVKGDLDVTAGARLSVAPGATMAFAQGTRLSVGTEGAEGALEAVGTFDAPVLFTSAAATPAPGDWVGLRLGAGTAGTGSHVAFAAVAYAGADPGQGGALANVAIEGGDAALDHAMITNSAGAGLWVAADAAPTLDESTLTFDANAQGNLIRE